MPCHLSWRVCWKEQTFVLCCYCHISPLCSIPPCPWRLDQRPDYLFLVSEAMVYVVPRTHARRPDRPSKTIFPEDVSENMTWMCLANPRFFCFAEQLSSRLPTLLCREDRENPLMSNLWPEEIGQPPRGPSCVSFIVSLVLLGFPASCRLFE